MASVSYNRIDNKKMHELLNCSSDAEDSTKIPVSKYSSKRSSPVFEEEKDAKFFKSSKRQKISSDWLEDPKKTSNNRSPGEIQQPSQLVSPKQTPKALKTVNDAKNDKENPKIIKHNSKSLKEPKKGLQPKQNTLDNDINNEDASFQTIDVTEVIGSNSSNKSSILITRVTKKVISNTQLQSSVNNNATKKIKEDSSKNIRQIEKINDHNKIKNEELFDLLISTENKTTSMRDSHKQRDFRKKSSFATLDVYDMNVYDDEATKQVYVRERETNQTDLFVCEENDLAESRNRRLGLRNKKNIIQCIDNDVISDVEMTTEDEELFEATKSKSKKTRKNKFSSNKVKKSVVDPYELVDEKTVSKKNETIKRANKRHVIEQEKLDEELKIKLKEQEELKNYKLIEEVVDHDY